VKQSTQKLQIALNGPIIEATEENDDVNLNKQEFMTIEVNDSSPMRNNGVLLANSPTVAYNSAITKHNKKMLSFASVDAEPRI